MYNPRIQSNNLLQKKDTALLFPLLIIGVLVIVGGLALFYLADDTNNPFKDMYLMPYVVLLGVVIAVPNFYLIYKKQFNVFHPIVFASWSYFVPAFFLGGLFLASGLSQPFFLVLVDDERNSLPLTLLYVIVGFAGLSLGFFFSYSRKLAERLSRRLPSWKWKQENILLPALLLVALGWGNNILAFTMGILGYQKEEQVGEYDGLVYLLTLFWLQGCFILWMCIFRANKLNVHHYLIIGLLLATSFMKAVFQGNRGTFLMLFFLVACAFIFAARKIETRHRVYGGGLLVLALLFGMIYGTTFRSIKQGESRVTIDEYLGTIALTFDRLADQDLTQSLGNGMAAIVERFEAVSTLAVIVSNYERLEPYEESYGLKNNIYNDLVLAFIPRPLWKDKPIGSDLRKFADLYFSFGESSFSVTPMGDLLRNYGPIGVPAGMFVLGFLLRLIYTSLVENQEFSYWRTALYYILLTSVTYEGFYGTSLLAMLKHGTFAVIGIVFIQFYQSKIRKA